MIIIDPLDDEVIQKKKPERSRKSHERRSPRHPSGTDQKHETKRQSRLVELALRLLRGKTGEEE
jgi:hypothetical protein